MGILAAKKEQVDGGRNGPYMDKGTEFYKQMEGLHIRLDEQAPPKFLMQYDWLSQQQLDVLFFETS